MFPKDNHVCYLLQRLPPSSAEAQDIGHQAAALAACEPHRCIQRYFTVQQSPFFALGGMGWQLSGLAQTCKGRSILHAGSPEITLLITQDCKYVPAELG